MRYVLSFALLFCFACAPSGCASSNSSVEKLPVHDPATAENADALAAPLHYPAHAADADGELMPAHDPSDAESAD